MYIIVVGGGKVGYYLTKALLDEGHEVLLVEKNVTICKNTVDEMGSVCFRGDGCEASTLAEVGAGRADMLIAVTGDDEDNLVACQVAKHKFNVPRTISRIRNPKNETIFKKLGIDVTVSSTNIILEHIEEELPTHSVTRLLDIRDKGMEIVEVKILPESTTVGKAVRELSLPEESSLCLLLRKQEKPIIPKADTILQSEDRIIAITPLESEEVLRATLTST
ncbi:MAG TPA: TrkA family potassium uptake protein [Dehalococcoidia bacterium]|jgi:trk system potassium uptake protein TrkA|nr:TrkA family potassium uptake protein [Dehalococcoidia bacterium]